MSEIEVLRRRVDDLLRANNELVERERAAKREADTLADQMAYHLASAFEMARKTMADQEVLASLREQAGQAILLEADLENAQRRIEDLERELEQGQDAYVLPVTGEVIWISPEGNPYVLHRIDSEWFPATFNVNLAGLSVKIGLPS